MNDPQPDTTIDRPLNVLVLLHCYRNLGGVELFTRRLFPRLSGCTCTVAFPERGSLVVGLLGSDGELIEPQTLPFAEFGVAAPFSHPVCEGSLARVLDILQPDLIHIVHYLNWPLAAFRHVLARGRPVILSHHDYYAMTPIYTLEGGSGVEETISEEYSKRVFNSDISGYLKQRRHYLTDVFSQIPIHTVPSNSLGTKLQETFGITPSLAEYGIDPFTAVPTGTWPGFRFGYYGSLLPQKGWESLVAAFTAIQQEFPHAELHLFGGAPHGQHEAPGVVYHGPFTPAELPQVIAQSDVALIPSIFPETYSMMLSELWRAGKPTAVADIGALGERIEDGKNGRKFTPGDSASIAEVMRWFLTSGEWRQWQIPKVPDADEMALTFLGLYHDVLAGEYQG